MLSFLKLFWIAAGVTENKPLSENDNRKGEEISDNLFFQLWMEVQKQTNYCSFFWETRQQDEH